MLYLDTSALVKLVVTEAESTALRRWLRAHPERRATSELARVELVRSVGAAGAGDGVQQTARSLFAGLALVPVTGRILESAATLPPPSLRSLDAIHVASALLLGADTTVVSYDERLASAARSNNLAVVAPA